MLPTANDQPLENPEASAGRDTRTRRSVGGVSRTAPGKKRRRPPGPLAEAGRSLFYRDMPPDAARLLDECRPAGIDPIRQAELLCEIKSLTDYTGNDIALLIGYSPVYVRQLPGLLRLRQPVQMLVRTRDLAVRKALILTSVAPELQVDLAWRVVLEGWTAEVLKLEIRALEED